MSGYTCPECGSRMHHGETSPGTSRWTCTNVDCGWDASEATAARYLKERPDDPEFEADMTKEEVTSAVAYPPGEFTVEGERSPQHPEGLTSEGERPAHVTNRPLGGDEEMAVAMEAYADSHHVTITDSNIDAIAAQIDVRDPAPEQQRGRAEARQARQQEVESQRDARKQRVDERTQRESERTARAEAERRAAEEGQRRAEQPQPGKDAPSKDEPQRG